MVLNAASMSTVCHGVGTLAALTTLLVCRSILSLLKLGRACANSPRSESRRSGTTVLTSSAAAESLVRPMGRTPSDQAFRVSSRTNIRTR